MRIDFPIFAKSFSAGIALLILLFTLLFTAAPSVFMGDLVQLDWYWGFPAPSYDYSIFDNSGGFHWGGVAFDLIFWPAYFSIVAFGIRDLLRKAGLNIHLGYCLVIPWFITFALYAFFARPDIPINQETGGYLRFLESRSKQIDMAIEYGDVETLIALFKKRPDLISKPDAWGERPLYKGAYWGQARIVRLLLADKADFNATRDGTYADTPLFEAADGGYTGALKLLIRAGANVNGYDGKDGKERPLLAAARQGINSVVLLLLANHANINARESDGLSALHKAVRFGRTSTVQILAASNADVNLRAPDGETPLFYALKAAQPNIKIVEILLSHGADPNAANTDGITPTKIASDCGYTNILKILRQHGGSETVHLEKQ